MTETKERRKRWIEQEEENHESVWSIDPTTERPEWKECFYPVIELHDGDVILSREEVEKIRSLTDSAFDRLNDNGCDKECDDLIEVCRILAAKGSKSQSSNEKVEG